MVGLPPLRATLARRERRGLADTALRVGPDAPTLCGDWDTKDLVCHLLVRESSLVGAPGIAVPALSGLTDKEMARLKKQPFEKLVERLRTSKLTFFSLPPVDAAVNTLEFFVHHEDIRRGRPGWQPRELTDREKRILFKGAAAAGKRFVKSVGVPVEIRWTDGERERSAVLHDGDDPVVLTGDPGELVMFLFGRSEHTGLTFEGPQASVDALTSKPLGI
jgi:uncharacterized protein (TIGR03085 family)